MTFVRVTKKVAFQMLNVVEKPTEKKPNISYNYVLLLLIKIARLAAE